MFNSIVIRIVAMIIIIRVGIVFILGFLLVIGVVVIIIVRAFSWPCSRDCCYYGDWYYYYWCCSHCFLLTSILSWVLLLRLLSVL